MGKYTHLRHKLEPFEKSAQAQGQASWFAKVNEFKQWFLANAENPEDVNPSLIAFEYAKRDREKRELEMRISELNVELEALSKLGVEAMDEQGLQKIDLSNGGYASIKVMPYYSVEDRRAAFAWIKKNKMTDLLTLAYQTMTGMNNERLLAGKPLIPGTKVFGKISLTVRGVNGNGQEEES